MASILELATDKTISLSPGTFCMPKLSLSFLDVYGFVTASMTVILEMATDKTISQDRGM
jgi:hypothetical protein